MVNLEGYKILIKVVREVVCGRRKKKALTSQMCLIYNSSSNAFNCIIEKIMFETGSTKIMCMQPGTAQLSNDMYSINVHTVLLTLVNLSMTMSLIALGHRRPCTDPSRLINI